MWNTVFYTKEIRINIDRSQTSQLKELCLSVLCLCLYKFKEVISVFYLQYYPHWYFKTFFFLIFKCVIFFQIVQNNMFDMLSVSCITAITINHLCVWYLFIFGIFLVSWMLWSKKYLTRSSIWTPHVQMWDSATV